MNHEGPGSVVKKGLGTIGPRRTWQEWSMWDQGGMVKGGGGLMDYKEGSPRGTRSGPGVTRECTLQLVGER